MKQHLSEKLEKWYQKFSCDELSVKRAYFVDWSVRREVLENVFAFSLYGVYSRLLI
jgi:hypothetical protein